MKLLGSEPLSLLRLPLVANPPLERLATPRSIGRCFARCSALFFWSPGRLRSTSQAPGPLLLLRTVRICARNPLLTVRKVELSNEANGNHTHTNVGILPVVVGHVFHPWHPRESQEPKRSCGPCQTQLLDPENLRSLGAHLDKRNEYLRVLQTEADGRRYQRPLPTNTRHKKWQCAPRTSPYHGAFCLITPSRKSTPRSSALHNQGIF